MRAAGCVVGFLLLAPPGAGGFVTLQTSAPAPYADTTVLAPPEGASAPFPDSVRAATSASFPRRGAALFLSGNDERAYAALGLLRALQEYRLAPDLVVAEGAATLPAAAHALGYRMQALDSLLRRDGSGFWLPPPTPASLAPDPRWDASGEKPWTLWSRGKLDSGTHARTFGCVPDASLSWFLARLLREAPDSAAAREPSSRLAFQMTEARSGRPSLVFPGNIQALAKASFASAPAAAACGSPWLNGGTVSRGTPLPAHWPVLLDRVVVLRSPGNRAPNPLPAAASASPLDSLRRDWSEASVRAGAPEIVELPLRAEANLPADPAAAWMEMGYRAGLRSMDLLRVYFAPDSGMAAPPSRRGGEGELWANAAINPNGEGHFQLFHHRLRRLTRSGDPKSWITGLKEGGFYPDLDVEWRSPGAAGPQEGLELSASENSRVALRAGAAYKTLGQPLTRHFPEGMAVFSWAEPYYLPFRLDLAGLGGGARPGFGGQFLVEPPWPMWLRLQVYNWRRTHRLELPTKEWEEAGATRLLLREKRGGLRVSLGASPRACLILEAARLELKDLAPHPDIEDYGYEAVEFSAGLLHERRSGRNYGRIEWTTSFSDPLELPGLVREPRLRHRGSASAVYGGWEGFLRGQYDADPETPWWDVYDRWLAGNASPFSFGRELMIERWRHGRSGAAGSGLNLAWRRFGFRAVGGIGGHQLPGPDGRDEETFYPFWETGGSVDFFGSWRFSAAGFSAHGPFLALQWGQNLDLESLFFDGSL